MKTIKDIIGQYYPDGNFGKLNLFNENKIVRMIEEAVKLSKDNKLINTNPKK